MQGYLEWLSMTRIDVVGHSRPERGSSGFVHVRRLLTNRPLLRLCL
jgi:hypothetical protein